MEDLKTQFENFFSNKISFTYEGAKETHSLLQKIIDDLDNYDSLLGSKKPEDVNRMSKLLKGILITTKSVFQERLQDLSDNESHSLDDELDKLHLLEKTTTNYENGINECFKYHKLNTGVEFCLNGSKKTNSKKVSKNVITFDLKIPGFNNSDYYANKAKIIDDYKERNAEISELEKNKAVVAKNLEEVEAERANNRQKNISGENELTIELRKLLEIDISKEDIGRIKEEYDKAEKLLKMAGTNKEHLPEDAVTNENFEKAQKEYNKCYTLYLKSQLLVENMVNSLSDDEYENKLNRIKGLIEEVLAINSNDDSYKELLSIIGNNISEINDQKTILTVEEGYNKEIETINARLAELNAANNGAEVQEVVGPFTKPVEVEIKTVTYEEPEEIVIEEVGDATLDTLGINKYSNVTTDNADEEEIKSGPIVEDKKEEPYILTNGVKLPDELLKSYDSTPGSDDESNNDEKEKPNIVPETIVAKLPETESETESLLKTNNNDQEIVESGPENLVTPIVSSVDQKSFEIGSEPYSNINVVTPSEEEIVNPNTIINKEIATDILKNTLKDYRDKLSLWWTKMMEKLFSVKPHTLTKGGVAPYGI